MVSLGLEYETIAGSYYESGDWHTAMLASPNLILLDLTSLRDHGLSLCQNLRAISAVPIIALVKNQDQALGIVGLEIGADDFVTDQFHPDELRARVRAVLRRAQRTLVYAQVAATD